MAHLVSFLPLRVITLYLPYYFLLISILTPQKYYKIVS